MNKHKNITKTDGVCGGRAVIAGTRMPVWSIMTLLAQGHSHGYVAGEFELEKSLVYAASRYAKDNILEIINDVLENERA